MSTRPTRFDKVINELSTAFYRAVLKDSDEEIIQVSDIDSLTLTLSNVADDVIINTRDEQDVLNANDVTVNVSGELEYAIQSEDNVIVDDTVEYETHRATFIMVYSTVNKFTWDVDFKIRNLVRVVAEEE